MDSKKPKKIRKKFYSLKLHELHKQFGVNLSKELRKSLKKRSLSARTGDKVKILKGKNKGKSGKIIKFKRKKLQVFIEGVTRKKADGTEISFPISPSNLLLIDVSGDDKKRGITIVKTKKAKEEEKAKKEVSKKVGEK